MLHKIFISGLALLSLISCNAQKKTKTSTGTNASASTHTKATNQQDGNTIFLSEGENIFLKEYEMNVTFKGISEDSRCPDGVNCIWAGVAVAQLEVMGVATRPMTLNLSTTDEKSRNYHNSAAFNGYTFSLSEVKPYPDSKDGSKNLKGKYKIGITIKKSGEDSTTR